MKERTKASTLLIIYTGGTIGMKHDATTNSLKPFPFDNILDEIPELRKTKICISTIAFNPPIDSSNINPKAWVQLAEIIEENYDRYDGFIVLHGTDTMAYSASALSFMLENLHRPVILTGSQLPIGSLRTNAKENLVTAIEIAASWRRGKPVISEVAIFFQSKLFRGNRTIKHNTEEFKAFQSYNYPALAETGVHIKFNFGAIHYHRRVHNFKIHRNIDTNVSILKLFPGISQKVVHAIVTVEGLKGLVLETFGAGNAPNEEWFLNEIREAINRGIIIVSVTQCAEGRVEMGMYHTSTALAELGVVNGKDITTEAAVTKLMVLLGKYNSHRKILSDLNKSISGEISD